jgi:peptidoglycan/LPS O-acetylase OafA/YrhL
MSSMERKGPQAHNNFDCLRIVAALMVLGSHQFALMGLAEPGLAGYHSVGGFGVLIFFSISGFLVARSWERDPNLWRFAIRRLLRIWPGLMVLVVLTTLVLGPAMTRLPIAQYLADPDTWHYFSVLGFRDVEQLPGVFVQNTLKAVNGSLWTLPIEVTWYAILAGLALLGAIRWRFVLLLCTVVAACHYFFVFDVEHALVDGRPRHWREEFGLFFLAGACISVFSADLARRRSSVTILFAAGSAALLASGRVHAALWLLIPILTIGIGQASWPVLRRFGRFGDVSYGVYIYAFPAQQAILAATGYGQSVAAGLATSTCVTLFCAFLSWHGVEKRALKLKPARVSSARWWRHFRGGETERAIQEPVSQASPRPE